MKKSFFQRAVGQFLLTLLMAVLGIGQSVAMGATGTGSADAGRGGVDDEGNRGGGVATVGEGQEIGDPEWYEKFIDQEIAKVQPTSTPLLQLVGYAKKLSGNSMIVKYYTNGYRPYKTKVKTAFTEPEDASVDRWVLHVNDPGVFTEDDTILVMGVNGYEANGTDESNRPLMLIVCEIDKSTGMPVVFAANGLSIDGSDNIVPPAINANTKLLRMGKAAPELVAQTGTYYNKPKSKENHVQKFMTQVEASTIEMISAKEVKNFTWTDQEEDAITDMKRTMEFTFMWGVKSEHAHGNKNGTTWTCDGIWDMAGKEIQVGTYNSTKQCDEISEDDMVDVLKDLYAGTNLGGKQKVLLAGSDFLATLCKIKSDRLIYRETVEKYGLKFKSFDSEFGELLVVHAEVLNAADKSKWALAIDPDFLRKYTFRSWARNVIDKNAIGVSETQAAVLREMSCCYLKYAPAHARLFLASEAGGASATVIDDVIANGANEVVRKTFAAANTEETNGETNGQS
ncbi:MAG: DUF5309 domain-containing protein [Bacteroidales bacterium]|nr:DUF5309 domain-containing protein [Bacteroidales bacterium]